MIADAWTRLYDSAILSFYTESLSKMHIAMSKATHATGKPRKTLGSKWIDKAVGAAEGEHMSGTSGPA